ncbi:MAG: 1-deoxy-D-xylulose-5-phosphate reductoisomerase, partial [Candidatus Eremiobacteraeota bacterium]|nr:1-deoxy-D-xylulose-5-phosphate reductoisomerase [Candidatus Eremiobacteraeota bacterium]
LLPLAAQRGVRILPVDSEHSAIFQCLVGESRLRVRTLVLTASGGPFLRASKAEMENATLEAALAHPTWRMGVKNTIDSATMMNKGLEAIEASRLFEVPPERVQVLVHPQSVAHGFVVFTDGSVKAQLAPPDMRVPIGFALAYPDRLPAEDAAGDPLAALGARGGARLQYDFEAPDFERFPCLALAYQAMRAGGTATTILSAANEIAVEAFVEGSLPFPAIARVIERTMEAVETQPVSLDNIKEADRRAREVARTFARGIEV